MKAMMMMNPPIVVILPPSLVRPDLLKTTKQLWIAFIWQHVSTLCSIWTHQRVFYKLHINPQITCAWRFEAVCHRRSNQGPIMYFTQLCNRKNEREMISEHRNKWIDIFLSSSNWMHLSDPHWSWYLDWQTNNTVLPGRSNLLKALWMRDPSHSWNWVCTMYKLSSKSTLIQVFDIAQRTWRNLKSFMA